ncbi:histidine phosphatase family protein [Desulfospira joergensenii]|uniref:histidine phosphatase family protein n=1 Tax=Desulfospira joergensenii TaxID=53329 RepID=UPI0003B49B9B|nr:histidine phosphatase family protein [Desulfospira joergensenii]
MIHFSLIRHARTQWNLEKKIQGRKDLPLCPQGEEDARIWAENLAGQSFDLILASPLTRAGQTAKILAAGLELEIEYDKDLVEQDFGLWEGSRIKDLRRSYPEELEHQEALGWEFRPPKGESRTQVLNRGLAALARAAERFEGRNLLVVTHNSMIKCLTYHGLGRGFLPEEPGVLRPCHVHGFEWDLFIKPTGLNRMNLMKSAKAKKDGS